jgi:GNAT superfamily N-acetyltransferase
MNQRAAMLDSPIAALLAGNPGTPLAEFFKNGLFGAGRPVQDWMAQRNAAAQTAYGETLKRTANPDRAGAAMVHALAGNPAENPIVGGFGVGSIGRAGGLEQLAAKWSSRGVKNSITESGDKIVLNKVVVPKEIRSQGIGSEFMRDLIAYADATRKRLALSPSTDFGGSSVSRLINFYKRFGLVENKGRNKDLSVSETMLREPRK